jgi:hypothetical protein
MKINKILLLLFAVIISSCTATDIDDNLDCKCNRVVEVSSFNMQGQYTFGTYITINDCTGIQRQYQWQYENNKPKKGDCK